ncbi:DUF2452 domain-containing protein [Pseudomonadota bacterium]
MSGDYKKHEGKGELHQGEGRSAPYPVSRLGASVELVDLAQQISTADSHINTRVSSKLQLIADQIRHLQDEARNVLEAAQRDQDLHRAQCNFKRIPGKVYHLYGRADDSRYFSMLGPDEWGGKPPHVFLGSFRLENDMSWTPEDEIDRPDDSRELVRRLLSEC